MNLHMEQITHNIHHDVSFSPLGFFAPVDANLFTCGHGLDAL